MLMDILESELTNNDSASEFLAHYGVMGQKKGVRRWQNKDMSLTPEGRIHYGVGEPRKSSTTTSISKESYDKINDIYKSLSTEDRLRIDPDSKYGDNYYDSFDKYKSQTAYNGLSDDGFVMAEKISPEDNIDNTKGVEIGIGVLSKGRGTGTKLTKDLIDWFDNQDEYDTIWWPVDEDNQASINLATKCGFIKDPFGTNYVYAKDEAYDKLDISKEYRNKQIKHGFIIDENNYIAYHSITG